MDVSHEQKLAVEDLNNVHIISIPGSGKTRTIIAKVKAMVNQGLSDIFLVTFTNASANEMRERLTKECGANHLFNVTVSTIHSLMIAHFIKHLPSYKLLPSEEQATILHDIYKKEFSTKKGYEKFERYVLNPTVDCSDEYKVMLEKYKTILINQRNHTLDNIIQLGVDLMIVGKLPLLGCKYLMVDEYQDCDQHQVRLIILHGKMGVLITTVGDEDQGIFSFAGSLNYQAFLLQEKHLNSTRYSLFTNYRSKQEVLDAGFSLIEKNKGRIKKPYRAFRGKGGVVQHRYFKDQVKESEWVVRDILSKEGKGVLVLARTNALLDVLEEHLIEAKVDFYRKGGGSFFDVIECHLFLSTLNSLSKRNSVGIKRVLDVFFEHDRNDDVVEYVFGEEKKVFFPSEQKSILNALRNSYLWLQRGNVNKCIIVLVDVFLEQLSFRKYKNTYRIKMLSDVLLNKKGTLQQRIFSLNNKDRSIESSILLMSMHASKGLEQEVVYLIGFNNRVIPSSRVTPGVSRVQHLEEERRLAFVGMTRAKNELYISSFKNSAKRVNYYGVSEFIEQIEGIEKYDFTV